MVNEMNMLISTENPTTHPTHDKNRPTCPPMNAIGPKMTTSDNVVATTASAISCVALNAASHALSPFSSMCRKMFSCTTTASSTTMPTARIRPIMVKLLIEKTIAYMNAKVPTSDVGMASVAMMVVRQ